MNTLTNESNPPNAMKMVPNPKSINPYSNTTGIKFGTKGAALNTRTYNTIVAPTPANANIMNTATVIGSKEPRNEAILDFIPKS